VISLSDLLKGTSQCRPDGRGMSEFAAEKTCPIPLFRGWSCGEPLRDKRFTAFSSMKKPVWLLDKRIIEQPCGIVKVYRRDTTELTDSLACQSPLFQQIAPGPMDGLCLTGIRRMMYSC
jgi:hypothetical protein